MFRKIGAVVLFVHDFQKCLAFYRDTLGLEVVQLEEKFAAFRMHDQDFAVQEFALSAQMIQASEADIEPHMGRLNRVLLCAAVENVDAAYELLRAKGVVFTGPPITQLWGIRAAYFRDPEGNLWEIAHRLPVTA